ncbi:MAG: hypothetical protein JWM80_5798 [Cyanobacteria bacterium RYN_339]|nr:hypothetical protein [Cyanobacteria bacterium RYN_339]
MQRWIMASVGLALAGCAQFAPLEVTKTPAPEKKVAVVAAAGPRDLAVLVSGPGDLAASGKLLSDAMAGQIPPGGAAAGLTAAGLSFRVQDASDDLVPVEKGRVQLQTLAGVAVGKQLATDANGKVTLPAVPEDQLLTVIVSFARAGKPYRLASLVPPGRPTGVLSADPINTMIEARLRDVLGTQTGAKPITFDRLDKLHGVCNRSNVFIATASLRADRALGDATKDLNDVWTAEIAAKVKDPTDLAGVKGFVADVKAAVAPAPSPTP